MKDKLYHNTATSRNSGVGTFIVPCTTLDLRTRTESDVIPSDIVISFSNIGQTAI